MHEHTKDVAESSILGKREEPLLPENTTNNHEATAMDQNDTGVEAVSLERKPIKNILVIDDEEPIRKTFKEALERFGYKVTVASNGKEGIRLFRENPADLIITDIFMPDMDGQAFTHEVIQEFPGTKIFAITGKNTMMGIETELDIARELGAIKVYTKPIKLSALLEAIDELQPQKHLSFKDSPNDRQ